MSGRTLPGFSNSKGPEKNKGIQNVERNITQLRTSIASPQCNILGLISYR